MGSRSRNLSPAQATAQRRGARRSDPVGLSPQLPKWWRTDWLAQGLVEFLEGFGTRAEFRISELVDGLVDDVEIVVQVRRLGLDIEHAGDDFSGGLPLLQILQGGDSIVRVV